MRVGACPWLAVLLFDRALADLEAGGWQQLGGVCCNVRDQGMCEGMA